MYKHLDLLVDTVHDFRSEEAVACKILVKLKLKAVNMERPC